jgi:hypothetical protein
LSTARKGESLIDTSSIKNLKRIKKFKKKIKKKIKSTTAST